MLKKKILLPCMLFAVLNLVAGYSGAQQLIDQKKGLKDYYKNFFPIGVAVTPQQLKDSAQRQLILKHFNSLTAENAMKMSPIHPMPTMPIQKPYYFTMITILNLQRKGQGSIAC